MIGYLEGSILKKDDDRILLLVNQIGYEVLLPVNVMQTLAGTSTGESISLYIYFQQTERQPKPVLIGFNLEAEREFFERFISVEAIGPIKAVKALTLPIRDIARAIESGDIAKLRQLKGIGNRTAHKIVATLQGKMEKFALIRKDELPEAPQVEDITEQVLVVLIKQLGHKKSDARRMIADALTRNSAIRSPEDLFNEVYRGEISP
ncbi:Holliday junction ATP-dependent DNA helicase RuvA (EC [Olavius algarvensis associated proteobacterium Delta 3]|nr:Holliday junction ATP-dependent DNA helicase RuvA (EC [Olavius algarvensis associated proteobacterium Delta 3]CAB5133834.1 Holliday junction ATP-dependent DNA helicase RuvA (EC [Olavius algarvensis associated proteobacterium Delta 3]